MNSKELVGLVAKDEELMVESLCSMLRIRAVGPENNGEGEAERGAFLVSLAKKLGFKSIETYEASDPRVPSGRRPNIIFRVKGTTNKNLYVVTHMDTVPEGDLKAWQSPPYEPRVADGRVYGRGSEDNGQELVASLYGLKALIDNGITPECNIGLVFVSDEEYGNTHGIDFLIGKGLFKKDDMAVVPDHGEEDGSALCVVEKSIAWINVEVIGKQTHGSTPAHGVNALEVAARYMLSVVDELRSKFSEQDSLFDVPISTFSPTKCDANGPNVNTIPGRQQFAFDFRILPLYKIDDVLSVMKGIADKFEKSHGAKINVSFVQRADAAPRTSPDSEIVRRLTNAITDARGIKPHPLGIGGGTCAAPFRRIHIESVAWSTIPGVAHDANEYANIKNIVADAQVYALLFAGNNVNHA